MRPQVNILFLPLRQVHWLCIPARLARKSICMQPRSHFHVVLLRVSATKLRAKLTCSFRVLFRAALDDVVFGVWRSAGLPYRKCNHGLRLERWIHIRSWDLKTDGRGCSVLELMWTTKASHLCNTEPIADTSRLPLPRRFQLVRLTSYLASLTCSPSQTCTHEPSTTYIMNFIHTRYGQIEVHQNNGRFQLSNTGHRGEARIKCRQDRVCVIPSLLTCDGNTFPTATNQKGIQSCTAQNALH